MRSRLAMLPAALSLGLLTSCNMQSPATGAGSAPSAYLVFTSSNPTNGDAVLDAPTVLYTPNVDGSLYDSINVTQTVGSVNHSFYLSFSHDSGAFHTCLHSWDPSGSEVHCALPECPGSETSIDLGTRTATFTNQGMASWQPPGSFRSTVTGTIGW